MKFLIDMGVGKKVEEWFKQERYDVKSVRDLNIRSKDADILKLAVSEDRMIITMDIGNAWSRTFKTEKL
jgi:predicted nuclease of predicted toxin-antitoxin system